MHVAFAARALASPYQPHTNNSASRLFRLDLTSKPQQFCFEYVTANCRMNLQNQFLLHFATQLVVVASKNLSERQQ